MVPIEFLVLGRVNDKLLQIPIDLLIQPALELESARDTEGVANVDVEACGRVPDPVVAALAAARLDVGVEPLVKGAGSVLAPALAAADGVVPRVHHPVVG